MITTIQLLILIGYIFFIVKENGNEIPASISDSTYFLEGNKRYLFPLVLWTVGILNFFQPMEIYGALAGFGLLLTGTTMTFKSTYSHTDKFHYMGAGAGIVLSFLGLVFLHGLWYIPLLALVFMVPFITSPNRIFWIEIVSIVFVFLSYYFI